MLQIINNAFPTTSSRFQNHLYFFWKKNEWPHSWASWEIKLGFFRNLAWVLYKSNWGSLEIKLGFFRNQGGVLYESCDARRETISQLQRIDTPRNLVRLLLQLRLGFLLIIMRFLWKLLGLLGLIGLLPTWIQVLLIIRRGQVLEEPTYCMRPNHRSGMWRN